MSMGLWSTRVSDIEAVAAVASIVAVTSIVTRTAIVARTLTTHNTTRHMISHIIHVARTTRILVTKPIAGIVPTIRRAVKAIGVRGGAAVRAIAASAAASRRHVSKLLALTQTFG